MVGRSAFIRRHSSAQQLVLRSQLILHAADSEPGAREKKEEMVRAMCDARLVEISGVHDLLLDDAAQTIAALRAFLDGR